MEVIREESRSTPVAETSDICVVGGSCTGVFAAVAAARLGARVSIVECNGFFGGVAAAGLVNVWHSLYDTVGKQPIIAGLTREVIERLGKRNAVRLGDPASPASYCILNTEELKVELDELVTESGARPFLHARFVTPIMDGGGVTAALIEDKSGRRAIKARCFVDATGDGDLVARAGLPFEKRDDMQPPTTCALVHGLGKVAELNPDFDLASAVFDPRYPGALPGGFLWSSKHPGVPDLAMVAGTRVRGADAGDADSLTRAEIEGRRQVRAMLDILRGNFAGGRDLSLVALPAYIGVRETRHSRCLYRLTEQDILTGRRFPDAIAQGSYRVDIHYSDRPGLTFRYLDGREEYLEPGRPTVKNRWRGPAQENPTFYQVPYRCLVPEGSSNVLAAGRLIDADRGAYGAVRVMVNCNQTGQAAGTAAALAVDSDCAVGAVDTGVLRETLRKQGAIIT